MYLLKWMGSVMTLVVSVAILVAAWVYYPSSITKLMDFNLEVIRLIGDLPHGERAESALRLLAGEKMLLLGETSLLVRAITLFVRKTFHRR